MIQAAAAYKGIDVNFKHEVYATMTSAEAKTAFLSQGQLSVPKGMTLILRTKRKQHVMDGTCA